MRPADRTLIAVALALSVAALVISLRKARDPSQPLGAERGDGTTRARERAGTDAAREAAWPDSRLLEERLDRLEKRLAAQEKRALVTDEGVEAEISAELAEIRAAAIAVDPAAYPARAGALAIRRRSRGAPARLRRRWLCCCGRPKTMRGGRTSSGSSVSEGRSCETGIPGALRLDQSEVVRHESAESLGAMLTTRWW